MAVWTNVLPGWMGVAMMRRGVKEPEEPIVVTCAPHLNNLPGYRPPFAVSAPALICFSFSPTSAGIVNFRNPPSLTMCHVFYTHLQAALFACMFSSPILPPSFPGVNVACPFLVELSSFASFFKMLFKYISVMIQLD